MCNIDVPAWGQLLVALAALIVSIVALLSNKQIKELIRLTKEQKRQSDALVEQNEIFKANLEMEKVRFEREDAENLLKIRPVFRKENQNKPLQNQINLILRNYGSDAIEFNLEGAQEYGAVWHATLQTISGPVKNNDHLAITIYCSNDQWDGISFNLIYKADDGKVYKQKIEKVFGGNFQIEKV